ncbi:hypothetical protein SAMN04488123_10240 [Natribacillus halophilus]|uniref:Uncharacterized protein n=1 Tax=Natribacillus halophilus TaxID=549003 RepID=A0A1G8KDD7_9BACI|nr:hypothetical protein SAMN04488123_10240 [Natribacillus halophilus]
MTLESCCYTPKAGYLAPRGTRSALLYPKSRVSHSRRTRSALLYPKGRVSHSERDKKRVVIPQRQGISLREGPEACCYTPKAGYLTPRGTRSALLYPKSRVSRSERDKKRVAIPQKQGISLREGQEACCYTPKAGYPAPRGTKNHVIIPRTTGIEPIREGDVILPRARLRKAIFISLKNRFTLTLPWPISSFCCDWHSEPLQST